MQIAIMLIFRAVWFLVLRIGSIGLEAAGMLRYSADGESVLPGDYLLCYGKASYILRITH
ncbi:MAG TPA: hypothetical protein G4O16_09545 [Dehalococcoidia bacterium]|nr:hypothetical protein [Dehalococcoidia bacterium]